MKMIEWCARDAKPSRYAPMTPCSGKTIELGAVDLLPRSPCPVCGKPIHDRGIVAPVVDVPA